MTSGVDRATLPIMGRSPTRSILSIDDGVPYYPGITAIAESPRRRGVLYVGTDDGKLRMSMDDGKTFERRARRASRACPPRRGSPASRRRVTPTAPCTSSSTTTAATTSANYVYKSTDFGKTLDVDRRATCRPTASRGRSARITRARTCSTSATEIGLFVTVDGGQHWVELKNNMPTLPFNDLTIQTRDNDLVLASHGRGIWILDN